MSDTQSLSVPAVLRSFADPSGLLPGEDQRDFEAIRQAMIDDIQPETNLEWLWIFDLVELSWEILRYRCLKQRILRVSRVTAIETILQRLVAAGMPGHALKTCVGKPGGTPWNGRTSQTQQGKSKPAWSNMDLMSSR